ncbi:HAMP domain-containing protein, partial [candidate division KSB3 bacterium]|nr:HAMP domain-containing protein [candidate division KSB3 bacterium]MBD3326826.1 HAMP domain-containing protein [candidate division KSB3 bacterium]
MSRRTADHPGGKIPLRLVLTVPFMIQLVVVAVLIASLSFRNGQQAVNAAAHQLQYEITARIEQHLRTFLDTPHQITGLNASLMRQGVLDVKDAEALQHHFWEQIQIAKSITSIYFGNPRGGLAGSGREGADGTFYILGTDQFKAGPFTKYATDAQGNQTDLLTTVPDFDARRRPWYINAVEKGDATWTDVYLLSTGQDMAIAASRPVYDAHHTLLGVVSVDIFLSHLDAFMHTLDIGKTGQSFIIERSGLLVASSTDERPVSLATADNAPTRLAATDSRIPLIRHAAQFLLDHFGSYQPISDTQHLEFDIQGQRQFLHILPIQNNSAIDWLIAVVIPEADFLAPIAANTQTTTLLIIAALLIAVIIGVITAYRITRPIAQLNASAQALAQGAWEQPIPMSRIQEIDDLSHSFNQMSGQLQHTLETLTAEINAHKETEKALRE